MRVLNLIAASPKLVPFARFHFRLLQLNILSACDKLDHCIYLMIKTRLALVWWLMNQAPKFRLKSGQLLWLTSTIMEEPEMLSLWEAEQILVQAVFHLPTLSAVHISAWTIDVRNSSHDDIETKQNCPSTWGCFRTLLQVGDTTHGPPDFLKFNNKRPKFISGV